MLSGKVKLKRTSQRRDSDKNAEHFFEQWLWSEISRNRRRITGGAFLLAALIAIVLYFQS